jgi:hypothetical protein
MAYVPKEKKAAIKEALQLVIPKDWKWSLAVRNHSTAVLTISKAPIDLVAIFCDSADAYNKRRVDVYGEREQSTEYQRSHGNYDVSTWTLQHMTEGLQNRYVAATFKKIFDAMNTGNYDNSDIQTDYFDVGHYVDVQIGKWDKPFIQTLESRKAA